jgi:hypothetical protein
MNKYLAVATIAGAMSVTAVSAEAGGWGGYNGHNNYSSGLINVSPTVRTGNLKLLSGIGILNGSPILSGNNTGLGILGSGTGLLRSIGITNKGGRRGGRGHHRRR